MSLVVEQGEIFALSEYSPWSNDPNCCGGNNLGRKRCGYAERTAMMIMLGVSRRLGTS